MKRQVGMSRELYNQRLNRIIEECKINSKIDYSEIIEEMKKYKPQSLMWDVANAWNQWNQRQDAKQVIYLLENKCNFHRIYPGLKESIELLEIVYKAENDKDNADRIKCTAKLLEEDYSEYYKLQELSESYVNQELVKKEEIAYQTYILEDYIGYLLSNLEENNKRFSLMNQKVHQEALKEKNINYLLEEITSDSEAIFVLVENEENRFYIQYIYQILLKFDNHVYYLKTPLRCPYEGIEIRDTLQISLENAYKTEKGIEFIPIEFVFENGECVDNRDLIIRLILKHYYQGKRMLHILASGYMIDDLSIRPSLQKEISRITPYKYDIHECNLCCCICGNYLEYISKIYEENCQELVEKKPDKKFSIVIPVRNSSETLRYTLKTCLEQKYQGKYEILISDNSTNGNSAVKDLIDEFQDKRIVYIKTPKDLELAKSFEFAYLHTSGEYVLPIGSDDGVLPWALETLDYITKKYPKEYIIQWERGFYAWPGFNGGQQNQFDIPRKYEKGNLNLYYRESKSYIDAVKNDAQNMYSLPLLYINSCFKREYFKVLLEKTGRLWDGPCQDIHIGAFNVCLNSKILNCSYPLTIAGMSSTSIGAINNTPDFSNKQLEEKEKKYVVNNSSGAYCFSFYDRMMNCFGVDTDGIYLCFLRAYNNGILEDIFFEWKSVYEQLRRNMDIRDVRFEYKMENSRQAARMQGEEFLQWFDENFYSMMQNLYIINEKKREELFHQKRYVVGENIYGGRILDASEYGVKNIYDAVQLFANLTEL